MGIMKTYKMDLTTKTLTVTRAFAETALSNLDSEEAKIIARCRAICPDLKFAYYTNRKTRTKKSNSTKGLTYTKMENYIRLYENRDELLNMFYKVRSLSQIQTSPYHFVCNWFFSQFPDYDCIPEFVNGKLYADVYSIPEAKDNGSKISVAA